MTETAREIEKYGLNKQEYESCLQDIRGKLNGLNDMDWSEIVEKYHLESRDELIAEKFCDAVRRLPSLAQPEPLPYVPGQRTGILCFGDTHYGVDFTVKGLYGKIVNRYNPEIFEQRMEELLSQTIAKIRKEQFGVIKVYSLGDELEGILRASQLMKLRYGVVESTIRYADYICGWLNRLSEYVCVEYQMVMGNHTELRMLGQPKGTFLNDNMSKIICEFIRVLNPCYPLLLFRKRALLKR